MTAWVTSGRENSFPNQANQQEYRVRNSQVSSMSRFLDPPHCRPATTPPPTGMQMSSGARPHHLRTDLQHATSSLPAVVSTNSGMAYHLFLAKSPAKPACCAGSQSLSSSHGAHRRSLPTPSILNSLVRLISISRL